MRGPDVLARQIDLVHAIFRGLSARIPAAMWAARPHTHANPVGFTLWHSVASQDWTLNMAVLGRPCVRQQGRWTEHSGINPPLPPFGMAADEADQIARNVTVEDVLAYEREVHAALIEYLGGLTDADLDHVPDVMANARLAPAAWQSAGYFEEAHDMLGWTVARHLSSPCIGHVRGHFGEIDVLVAMTQP